MKTIASKVKLHFHKHYLQPHGARAHLVLSIDLTLIAIILALLAVGGYYAFLFKPIRDDFRFEVLTDQAIVAGRETTVTLRIANVGKQNLHGVTVQAHLPPEFRVRVWPNGVTSIPNGAPLPVGDIARGAEIKLPLTGTVYGPPNTEEVFVRMTATDDTGALDEKLFGVKIHWDENLITSALAFPAQLVANQTFPVRFTLTNGSTQKFDDVRVVPHWPANFRVVASTPPVANGMIAIGTLDAGESVTVELQARYKGHAEDFNAEVDTYWFTNSEQVLLDSDVIQRSSIDVNMSMSAAFANGASVFAPGDTVPVKISYKNDSPYALKNVIFSAPLDPRFFDQKTPTLVLPTVREIPAGAAGEVEANVTLSKTVSRYAVNPSFTIVPSATFSITSPEVDDVIVGGNGAQAKISGTAELRLAARYFTSEGDQLGRGPLPPRVGKTTTYWVSATVATGANDFTNGQAIIVLPTNVRWTGKQAVSAGNQLTFDDARHAIIWNLGDIAAHAGTNDPAATASFEVALTPDTAGSTPALASSATFTAIDTWIGASLTDTAGAVTTKLTGDGFAQGKGIVRP